MAKRAAFYRKECQKCVFWWLIKNECGPLGMLSVLKKNQQIQSRIHFTQLCGFFVPLSQRSSAHLQFFFRPRLDITFPKSCNDQILKHWKTNIHSSFATKGGQERTTQLHCILTPISTRMQRVQGQGPWSVLFTDLFQVPGMLCGTWVEGIYSISVERTSIYWVPVQGIRNTTVNKLWFLPSWDLEPPGETP